MNKPGKEKGMAHKKEECMKRTRAHDQKPTKRKKKGKENHYLCHHHHHHYHAEIYDPL